MSDIEISITVDRTKLYRDIIKDGLKQAIKKACFDTEAGMKKDAAVDTGAMEGSIYASVPGESHYSQAKAAAEAANADFEMLPEIAPQGELEGIVSVGAEYGPYVNYGNGKSPAQPFVEPTVERVGEQFDKVAARLINRKL
jgi:HK97 gp10 family phage protein